MPFLRHLASRIVRSLSYICKKVVRAKRKVSNYCTYTQILLVSTTIAFIFLQMVQSEVINAFLFFDIRYVVIFERLAKHLFFEPMKKSQRQFRSVSIFLHPHV